MNINLSGKTAAFYLFALIATLAVATAHGADQKWWHTSSPNAAVNGQITLKNGTGATRTINNNPTGATLATRTANTQPPTVIVQATATLPVVAEGSACNNAVDTAAVNSDKTLILTCQSSSNTWVNVGGGKVKEIRQFGFPGNGSYDMGVPTATWVCALTYVSGKFAGGGEMMQLIPSTNWIFSGSSQSDQGINGGATCWRFG